MKSVQITVHGKVQGVWFRASTKREADRLGIQGSVQNRLEGTVQIYARGNPISLDEFISWCQKGPPHAHVTQVDVSDIKDWPSDVASFDIIR